MTFKELIVALKNANLTDSTTKPGTAKECVDAILHADLSHPVYYCNLIRANLKKMIEAGITGMIGPYTVSQLYEYLEPRTVTRRHFTESIPGCHAFDQYVQRKEQAQANVIEILSDPQRMNRALLDRDSLPLPAGSVYAQTGDVLGYLHDPEFKPDPVFVQRNATRVAGFLEQAFGNREVNELGYTLDKINKKASEIKAGKVSELREALVLEAVLYAVQSEYSLQDQQDILLLNDYVNDDYITNEQQEQVVSAIKSRQATISADKVLEGKLPELVSTMRVTLLAQLYARKLEKALLDPLTVNQFLLDGETIRESSVALPLAYLIAHPDILQNLEPRQGTNELHIPEPHPFRIVDLRGMTDLKNNLPNDAARQFFADLPKYQQIYMHGAMRQIEDLLYKKYEARIEQLQLKLSSLTGTLTDVEKEDVLLYGQEIKALKSRRDMVMQAVMRTLTAEKMTTILQSAFKPHYVEFMRNVSALDMTPVGDGEAREYKKLALKTMADAARKLRQEKYDDAQEAAEFQKLNEMCVGFVEKTHQMTRELSQRDAARRGDESFFNLDDMPAKEWDWDDSRLDVSSEELGVPPLDTSMHVIPGEGVVLKRQNTNESMASSQSKDEQYDRLSEGLDDDDGIASEQPGVDTKAKDKEDVGDDSDYDKRVDFIIELGRQAMQSQRKSSPAQVSIEHHPVHDVLPYNELRNNIALITDALLQKDNEAALAAIYKLADNIYKYPEHIGNVADANKFFEEHYPGLSISREKAYLIKNNGAILQDAISSLMQSYAGNEQHEMENEMQRPNAAFMIFAKLANVDFTNASYSNDEAIMLAKTLVKPLCEEAPVARLKISELNKECVKYMDHLSSALYDEMLNDNDPAVFEFLKRIVLFSEDGTKRILNVEKLLNPCGEDQVIVDKLKGGNESFSIALSKYEKVRWMHYQLQREELMPSSRLERFGEFLGQSRQVLETRRDSACKKFLRAVVNVLTFGITYVAGLWKVEGEKSAKKMDDILNPKPPRQPM